MKQVDVHVRLDPQVAKKLKNLQTRFKVSMNCIVGWLLKAALQKDEILLEYLQRGAEGWRKKKQN
ncbi:MAG: hypothetical protein QXG39_07165 [Candidatus Aenigmatarchaeota archaeon]